MRKKTVLTGIKPTGIPHIGNYVGAIKPALAFLENDEFERMFFIADYHAITAINDRKLFNDLCYEIAATWLACGLDPEKVLFYRQSDIPETFELSWLLSCLTAKGLMNRAHAYKASVDKNRENNAGDLDAGINMGLYNYPILMAADILIFHTDIVPVGSDQVQHVEIARDLAQRFNHIYGKTYKLTLPRHMIQEESMCIPGLDGRKMSKSYGNVIPLFDTQKKLRKAVFRIKTDSTPPDAPKDPAKSDLFDIYCAFATPEQIESMKTQYAEGISWADAKQQLFDILDDLLAEPREKYFELMSDKKGIDDLLLAGAAKARPKAQELIRGVRDAIGQGWIK
jgi:tryptophanyl-tRNA synthetase